MHTSTLPPSPPGCKVETFGRKEALLTDLTRKPPALPVEPAGIPAELRTEPRWVCWRWQPNKKSDRWTKVPLSPVTARNASSTNPATWGGFDAAVTAYNSGAADGVGFVLGDGWLGIDLDDCRDPDTGDLTEFARDVVSDFPGYTEVSPSGTGVKVIGRGTLPADLGRQSADGRFEAYDAGRYFALTGRPIGGAL